MKTTLHSWDRRLCAARRLLTLAWLLALSPPAVAATVYVSTDGAGNGPGTEWTNAFHAIQDALAVATNAGDLVLVSNGVYAAGGAVAGGISNRVVVPAGVTLQSVGGAAVTTIRAAGTMGPLAMRGVYLANQAVLEGFTVEGGTSDTVLGAGAIGAYGGGVFCLSTAATVRSCVIQDNNALSLGGGVYYGSVYNSILQRNTAAWGGGAFHANLYNCLVADNVAPTNAYWPTCGSAGVEYGTHYNCTVVRNRSHSLSWHAGLSQATAYNCIVYDNEPNERAPSPAYYSCIQKPSGIYVPSTGTITNRPQFVDAAAGHFGLAATSPCRDRGTNETWMVGTRDLADRPRTMNGRVDMGAYEFDTGEIEPVDTDGDGLPDDVERALGTDPDRPDSDNDGMQDGAELTAGTDPTNALDRLAIRGADLGGDHGAPVIGWSSVSGRFYEVLSSTNLLESWSNTARLPGDGLWLEVTNPPADVVPRYFRLTVTTNSAAP